MRHPLIATGRKPSPPGPLAVAIRTARKLAYGWRTSRLPLTALALSLILPALAGCNGQNFAGTDTTSASSAASLAALSSEQQAALINSVAPSLAVSADAEAVAADANDILEAGDEAGPGPGGQAGPAQGPGQAAGGRRQGPPPPKHGRAGGGRNREPGIGFELRGDGGRQMGGEANESKAVAHVVAISYDTAKKIFTVTTTIDHTKSFRGFTAKSLNVRTYDASALDAAFDPASVTTLEALQALKMTLLTSNSDMTMTGANGTNSAKRTEVYADGKVTIHQEITRGGAAETSRKLSVVRDSVLVQATGVETGTSKSTVTKDGNVISTVESTFTITHEIGGTTQTATDPLNGLRLSLRAGADGSMEGEVSLFGGGFDRPAGQIRGDGKGRCNMQTANGSVSLQM